MASVLFAMLAAVAMWTRRYRVARAFIVLQIGGILVAWAVAQAPYLIPPHITIEGSASASEVMSSLLLTYLGSGLVLLPSPALLFHVFKGRNPAQA